jgi:hypothetical protein
VVSFYHCWLAFIAVAVIVVVAIVIAIKFVFELVLGQIFIVATAIVIAINSSATIMNCRLEMNLACQSNMKSFPCSC